jgi:septal ring factor EnvC (AmiA/AmiB activator)
VRWAFANKFKIDSAIFQWSRDKMEQAKRAEKLPPETEEKIRQYEALQSELTRKQMETPRLRLPLNGPHPEAAAVDKEYEVLAQKVAEAKAPIADILERRSRQETKYREQYSLEQVIAEYVKGRYELVVDSDQRVLYRTTPEVPDITEGIITFFNEKIKL